MEKKIYTDNLERLLKEKSDEFRMYPSKRVWHSIYNDLHPGRKWPSVAMSMILVIALLLIGSLNTNDDSSVKTSAAFISGAKNASRNNNNALAQGSQQSDGKIHQLNDQASNGSTSTEAADLNSSQGSGNDMSTMTTDAASPRQGTLLTDNDNLANYGVNKNFAQNTSGSDNTVQLMDYYIKSNQLFSDVNELNKQKNGLSRNATSFISSKDENINTVNTPALQNSNPQTLNSVGMIQDANKATTAVTNTTAKTNVVGSNKNPDTNEQKAWMEDYALHNKSQRTKWKGRVSTELYATPSVGYRNLSSNINDQATTQTYAAGSTPNKSVSQKPSLNLEAGFGLAYSVTKKLKVKSGVQLNYTSYGVSADQINHPIGTSLLLNDPATGLTYLSPRTSTLSNSSGLQSVIVHNTTYQVSVPVGLALKLAGNNKVEWYAGASLQPSFVFGGSTNFISSDYSSYVPDASMLRKWNMNTGIETYLNYKMNGFNLQIGPQFRYQLLSTYTKKYTINENLYNVGIKVGLVKNF